MRGFQESVANGFPDMELWFFFSPLQWCFKNSHAFHKFALHGLKVKVWCAVNAHKIIRPVVLKKQ